MNYLPHPDITDGPNSAIDAPRPTVKESLTPQKPRCPWPVHQWHPQVKSVRVHDQTRLIVYLTTSPFPSYFDFDCSGLHTDTTWTRAEALASQMLPAPDRVGVWAIYFEGTFGGIDFFDNLTTQANCCNGSRFVETLDNRWGLEPARKFYFIGPLPTAEGEVVP